MKLDTLEMNGNIAVFTRKKKKEIIKKNKVEILDP